MRMFPFDFFFRSRCPIFIYFFFESFYGTLQISTISLLIKLFVLLILSRRLLIVDH